MSTLLARLAGGPAARPHPDVVETRDRALGDLTYDTYAPRGRPRGALVALHGVTVNGGRDERLVHFAQCLARAGVVCWVPTLPALAACRVDGADVDRVEALGLELARAHRPGFIGFSYGASYALTAAARPALAPRCRFVLAVGAFHALGDLITELRAADSTPPATPVARDDRLYMRLALAVGYPGASGLAGAALAEARALLERYCHAATTDEKEAFFALHLAKLDLGRLLDTVDPAAAAAVSPAGRLGGVRCPVSVVHDRDDATIAPVHAERIFRELAAGAPAGRHRLLVTALLSHVDLRQALRVGEVARLYGALAPIFAAA